jgi:membrane protease YdiL (CAAX protease family)
MVAVLWLLWRYLGGSWWPAGSAEARRRLLRSRLVPARSFAWAAVAGALALVALAGLWIVLVRLTGAGGNPTIAGIAPMPALTVALTLVVASLVSPLTEEAAFRGYAQVLLERRLTPVAAVAVSSALFALWHGPTQGFAPSKLLFYLLVGIVFGTIACLTSSVLPAIPVHIAGDLLFFTAIWPHDATRTVIWAHGPDAWFWLSAAQTLVFAGLAVLAFRRLAQWPMAARRD